jgi:hypothetical protein
VTGGPLSRRARWTLAVACAERSADPSGAREHAAEAPLDLHEGISDPALGGCGRWPEHMRLLSSHGEVVRGRCRATNQCSYCARLAAVENAELLSLDALSGTAPEVWAVLTTRTADADPARFYDSRRQVMRALQRRWPDVEYAALVEFTTGYGPRSHGARRPHWNLLLKGIPADDVDLVRDVITTVWCAREDAQPHAQFVGAIAEIGGLMRYLALHFQKESQRPPEGWRGHRFTKSRGYLATTTPEAREAARQSLRHKRAVWRALRRGLGAHDAELAAHEERAVAAETSWRLVHLALRQGAATSAREELLTPHQRTGGAGAVPALGGMVSVAASRPLDHGGAMSRLSRYAATLDAAAPAPSEQGFSVRALE